MEKTANRIPFLAELVAGSGVVRLVNNHLLYGKTTSGGKELDTVVVRQMITAKGGPQKPCKFKEMFEMLPDILNKADTTDMFQGKHIDPGMYDTATVEYIQEIMPQGWRQFYSGLGLVLFGDLTEKKMLALIGPADCGKSSLFTKVIAKMTPLTTYKVNHNSIQGLDNCIGAYRAVVLEELPKTMSSEFCDICKEIIGNNEARTVNVKCAPVERRTGTSYLAFVSNSDICIPDNQIAAMRDKIAYIRCVKPASINKNLDIDTLFSLAEEYFQHPDGAETPEKTEGIEHLKLYSALS